MVSKLLEKRGATVRAREMLQKAAIQMVMFSRSESLVIMEVMMKVLEAFHHHNSRRIMGKTAQGV